MVKRNKILIILSISFFSLSTINVFAEYIGGGGGASGELSGCGSYTPIDRGDGTVYTYTGTSYYNCCPGNNSRCPRWIKGSISDFVTAWNNKISGGGASAYDTDAAMKCMNPEINTEGYVYWFGDVYHDGVGGTVLFNWLTAPNQTNFSNGYIFGLGLVGFSVQDSTTVYNIARRKGLSITNLAFGCKMEEDEPEPEEPETCERWNFGTKGVTSVMSGVQNETLRTEFKTQKDEMHGINSQTAWVWAKPYDTINFCHQYYSGLQEYVNAQVTNADYANNTPPPHWRDAEYDYKGDDHSPQNKTISNGNQLISFYDFLGGKSGWGTVGFKIQNSSGEVSSVIDENNAAAPNYYKKEEKVTVDPLKNLGNPNLNNNYQEAVSLFRNQERNFKSNVSYADSWGCNPYTPEIHGTKTIKDKTYKQCKEELGGDWTSNPENANKVITSQAQLDALLGSCAVPTISYGDPIDSTCNLANDSTIHKAYFDTPTAISSAFFKVPYNFINRGSVVLKAGDIYAGETVTIYSANVETLPRENSTTQGYYATYVPNAQWKLAGYISDNAEGVSENAPSNGECPPNSLCQIYGDVSGNGPLNENGNYSGSTKDILDGDKTYNVWDVEAGRYYCSVLMVTPASSAGNEDMDGYGDGSWANNNPTCKIIYKKPTFQVRGPMYIESGEISQGAVATKNNVAGSSWSFDAFQNGTGNGKTRNFYSWVDQSLTIGRKATVKRFATGAAVNVKKDNGGKNIGGIFSSVISDEIFRSRAMQPLTIPTPSVTPTNAALDGIGAVLNSSFKSTVVESAKRTASGSETCKVDGLSLKNTDGGNNRRVIVCNGTLEINGDIIYDGNFEKMEQIPSVIIYASNGINIKSNVSRIDGWVIAESTIDTCSDGGACNKSLTFNGTVLAHEIKLNRTYGAGAGKRSSYPAELFNLSSAAFMYSASEAKKNSSKVPQTVYLRELAPRY